MSYISDSENIERAWKDLVLSLQDRFGKEPDLNAVLFLIGMQELGQMNQEFTKEQKQDLMHIATCTVLINEGYYKSIGKDMEGWPHFENTAPLPDIPVAEQELLLKKNIIRYLNSTEP